MFENFPYTDMHQLNLDWIIKIAKDFLDQYTTIQQIITDGTNNLQTIISDGSENLNTTIDNGLSQIQERADNIESLLNEWYTTHSADIANQLAAALLELNTWYSTHQDYLNTYLTNSILAFETAAQARAAETIQTIPADYSTLAAEVLRLGTIIDKVATDIEAVYDLEFSVTATSREDFTSAILTQGHRYTIAPEITTGTLQFVAIMDLPNFQTILIQDLPAGKGISFTAEYTGFVRVNAYSIPCTATIHIYDTTGNDALKDFIEENGYHVANSFMPTEQFKYNVELIVSKMNGNKIPLPSIVGAPVNPDFTLAFNPVSENRIDYQDIILTAGHRYTIAPYVLSGAIYFFMVVSGGNFDAINLQNVHNGQGVSFVPQYTGYVRISAYAIPATATVYVYDTTDNDTLKTFIENNGCYVASAFIPSSDFETVVEKLSGQYCNNNVLFIGDSQTQRGTYVTKFAQLFNGQAVVYKYGWGGAGCIEVSAVDSAIPMYVKPFTIPSSASAVQIELYTDAGGDLVVGEQSTAALANVKIHNIPGAITCVNNVNYFTRAETGTETAITRPEIVYTELYNMVENIPVIEMGTNDYLLSEAALTELIIKTTNRIVNHNNNDKYIVLGLTASSNTLNVDNINKALATYFGEHFIDTKTYLIQYGLEDESITPTAQDLEDIANNKVPSSLLSDAIHYNQNGGNVIGTLVYNRGKELNYWN